MTLDYKVVDLRCELLDNPLAVDILNPDLSWKIELIEGGGFHQSAYRVLVASTQEKLASGLGDLWDSGVAKSSQSSFIAYQGIPLKSEQFCYWKVLVESDQGVKSESAVATWRMGLLNLADWSAKWIGNGIEELPQYRRDEFKSAEWIWASKPSDPREYSVGTYFFRKRVALPEIQGNFKVKIWCYADDMALLKVNQVSFGKMTPVLCPPGIKPFQCTYPLARGYDITHLFHSGENELLLEATHQGGEGVAEQYAGLIAKIEITNGTDHSIVKTDCTWECFQRATGSEVTLPTRSLGSLGVDPWEGIHPRAFPQMSARYLRKAFSIKEAPTKAIVFVTGLGAYELYVNGHRVGDEVLAPHWSHFEKRVFYQAYDIAPYLNAGENAVGLMVGNGWYFSPRRSIPCESMHYGNPKAILQAKLEFADDSVFALCTDETWRVNIEGPLRWNNWFDGEVYQDLPNFDRWSSSGFDDSAWEKAKLMPQPGGELKTQMSRPQRVTRNLQAVQTYQIAPHRTIYDFGVNMSGWCSVDLRGKVGNKITIRHAEKLNQDHSLDVDSLRTALAEDEIILSDRPLHYEPRFVYHGFRYAEVEVEGGELLEFSIQAREVHDDLRIVGNFDSSSATLNQLFRAMVQGIRSNYHSVPVDCPQRDERMGWLGDRANNCVGEMFIFEASLLYRKWLLDFKDTQWQNGSVPAIAPPGFSNVAQMHIDDVTWPSCVTFVPFALYRHYGDLSVIRRFYPMMKLWVEHMSSYLLSSGLINRDLFGDWCVPPEESWMIMTNQEERKTHPAILASSFYFKNLKHMEFFAQLIGAKEDEVKFKTQAEAMKSAINREFYRPELGQYDNGSQTSFLLALAFNIVEAKNETVLFENFVRKLTDGGDLRIGVGLIGIQNLLRELTKRGRIDLALRLAIKTTYPSWGYMMEKGATTIWELWNGDTAASYMNSGNHVMLLGDLHIWLFETLGGIVPNVENPGFKRFTLAPYWEVDLDWVRVEHQSLYGLIRSEWKKEGKKIRWSFSIPPNSEARIDLRSFRLCEIHQNEKKIILPKNGRLDSGDYVMDLENQLS